MIRVTRKHRIVQRTAFTLLDAAFQVAQESEQKTYYSRRTGLTNNGIGITCQSLYMEYQLIFLFVAPFTQTYRILSCTDVSFTE